MTAAGAIATRYGVWPSMVYTAAFGALLLATTGSPALAYRPTPPTASRHARGRGHLRVPAGTHSVDGNDDRGSPTCSTGPCGAAVRRWPRLRAARTTKMLESVARHSGARGVAIRIGTVINHLRYPAKVRGGTRTIVNRNPTPSTWSLLGDDFYLRRVRVAGLCSSPPSTSAGRSDRGRRGAFCRLRSGAVAVADGAERRLSDSRTGRIRPAAVRDWVTVVDGAPVDLQAVAGSLEQYPAYGWPGVRRSLVAHRLRRRGRPGGRSGRLRAPICSASSTTGRDCRARTGRGFPRRAGGTRRRRSWAARPVFAPRRCRSTAARCRSGRRHDCCTRRPHGPTGSPTSIGAQLRRGRRRVLNIPRVQQIMRDRDGSGRRCTTWPAPGPLSEIAARFTRSGAQAAQERPHRVTSRPGDVTFTPATDRRVRGR